MRIQSLDFPALDEVSAVARWREAIKSISSEFEGGVLVVTHGEAVAAAFENDENGEDRVVYKVENLGYVELDRSILESSSTGWWPSMVMGTDGVLHERLTNA